jgi:predicted enzyme related to lactoylglutathione lyase
MVCFRFDCVFHYVRDMDRAVSFYSDVLGLELRSRDIVARFDIDGVLFELAPAPSEDDMAGGGNARLCLGVDNIDATLAELHERGVSTGQSKEVPGGTLAAFEDPDGNEIYLWQSDKKG